MKRELTFVVALILLVSAFAVTNKIPAVNTATGNFIAEFDRSSIETYYKQYGNIFEFEPRDGVILTNQIGNSYIIQYFKSDSDQFGFSRKKTTENAVLSIERTIRGDMDIRPYKIKAGKIESIKGLNVFVYVISAFDLEGLEHDRSIISFPNAASFIYRPRMKKGDTRIVDGHKLELLDYYYDQYQISRGFAKVKVDNIEAELRNYDKPILVSGLKIGVSEMEKAESVRFTILDVTRAELEEDGPLIIQDPKISYS